MEKFFTSYARADDNRLTRQREVVNRIAERVRALVGAPAAEEVVFFDRHDIRTGVEWEQALGDALRCARVLVCMCSYTFLNSEYCAKELEVFRRRLQNAGGAFAGRRVIIPVIWDCVSLPKALSVYQFDDDTFPERYRINGLYALWRNKGCRDRFNDSVEALAQIIKEELQRVPPLPQLPGPVEFNQLPVSFHFPASVPYQLAVVVLHERGANWVPLEGGRRIADLVSDVATRLSAHWREIPATANLPGQLHEAREAREIVIAVADELTAAQPRWRALLDVLDDPANGSCAVLVARPAGAATAGAERDAFLSALLPRTWAGSSQHDVFPASDQSAFAARLEQIFARIQITSIQAAQARPVVDTAVAEAAANAGIHTAAPPMLAVPAGGA